MAYLNKTLSIGDEHHNTHRTGSIHYIDEDDLSSDPERRPPSQFASATQLPASTNQISPSKDSDGEPGWLCLQLSGQCGCRASAPVRAVSGVSVLLVCWAAAVTLLGAEALPGGGLFTLVVLFLVAHVVGRAVALTGLPSILGMLLVGILARSTDLYQMTGAYVKIVSALREMSLAVILIKAGLGLDPAALLNLSCTVVRLAVCPGLAEAVAIAVLTHFILGYPWLWGLSLGFLLCAISPAVVVPVLLELKKQGYGEGKGISTLVIAASSIDDVLAISVYSICMSIIFSTGASLTGQLLQGPMDVALGLAAGTAWGLWCAFVPHLEDSMVALKRSVLVGGAATAAVLGCHSVGFPGAGPLFAITAPFVASTAWATQGWSIDENPVQKVFSWVWVLMEPVMFALIGVEIDVRVIQMDTVTWGLIIIAVSQVIRAIVCSLVLIGTSLNMKEVVFVNLAWLPKATVQAALAPQALDMAMHASSPQPGDVERASQCLTIAVLSILVTAPLGAVGAALGGPRLLDKGSPPDSPSRRGQPDTSR